MMYYFKGEGINFLFQGSANFIEKELQGLQPKTAVIAPVLYQNIDHFQQRLLGKLKPQRVFLNHFDNFFLPYSRGRVFLDEKELNQFITELKTLGFKMEFTIPEFFQEFKLED